MESDLELAFRLQLEEAIAASLSPHPPPSPSPSAASSSRQPFPATLKLDGLEAAVMLKVEQERRDMELIEEEVRKMRIDLSRRISDQKFARELSEIPDDDWEEFGDDVEIPFGEGSSSSSGLGNYETYRLYFKGLLSEERVSGSNVPICGIGIAICDPRDNIIFELKKPIIGVLSRQVADAKALLEGLEIALSLDLKQIIFFCDQNPIYQYVKHRWQPRQRKLAAIMNKVSVLKKKFAICHTRLVPRNEIKYVFKLARDAIESEVAKPADSSKGNIVKETCTICLEEKYVDQMFSVTVCSHVYCFSCMRQHMEVKLLHGVIPRCPHEGCTSQLNISNCEIFLTPKLNEMMKQSLKEASVPATEKVYCPVPRCSELMSKTQASEFARKEGVRLREYGGRKCVKCGSLFCVDCKVPWHSNMTCRDYKRLHPPTEDTTLKSLATLNLWRQCGKCNHMIELAEGCYHMTCRCGHEFCYTCGSEWKLMGIEKKPTCSCPLFDDNDDDDDDYDFTDDEPVSDDEDDEIDHDIDSEDSDRDWEI